MKKYPFKFLASYNEQDTDIFFGRDEEIAALYEMVFQTSLLLVYGASGTGKTSLLQCGLAGKFKSYDWLPITIRRGNNINASLEKKLTDAGGSNIDYDDELMAKDASKKLTGLSRLIKSVYLANFKPIYLIFDQFEELYVLGNKDEQQQFIESVKEILNAQQRVKIIFSIREEYLGYLFDFEKQVPQLLRKKLRIEAMSLDKVTDVIKGINNYGNSNVKIKEDETGVITNEIFERIKGKKNTLTIQLPYLQVFLDKVYLETTHDESRQADALITMDVLNTIGDIGDVLRNFLEEQVNAISKKLSTDSNKVTPEVIWMILSPFCTLEGTKEPISKNELANRLPGINPELINAAVEEFENSRIVKPSENENLYELVHDSLALRIAEKRSDEQIAVLQVQQIIKSQVLVKPEAREYFSENRLTFFEPYLNKFKLNDEEQDWINKSRAHVQELKDLQKKQQQEELAKAKKQLRTVGGLLALAVLAFVIAFFSWKNAKKATDKANLALHKAQQSDSTANAQTALALQAKHNDSLAKVAADIAYDTALAAKHRDSLSKIDADLAKMDAINKAKEAIDAKNEAEGLQKKAISDRDKIRSQNLKIAANEYARLIREGPSEENKNDKTFYGKNNDYFLAYTYHFDHLESLLAPEDLSAYAALKNKLYYNNDLYQRVYENLGFIGAIDDAVRTDNSPAPGINTKPLGNNDVVKLNDTALIISKANGGQKYIARPAKGQKFIRFITSANQHLIFSSTTDNFIHVFNNKLEKVASIAMGTKVTALDFNDDNNIIYFGTINGYIGYIEYGIDKKNQPIFENKLETEITAIQLFARPRRNDAGSFLLAAGKKSSARVYKLEKNSLKPDSRLIGNELPYKKEYGEINNAVYDPDKDRVQLFTTTGTYSWNPFTKELLDGLKEKEHFSKTDLSIGKTQIYAEQ